MGVEGGGHLDVGDRQDDPEQSRYLDERSLTPTNGHRRALPSWRAHQSGSVFRRQPMKPCIIATARRAHGRGPHRRPTGYGLGAAALAIARSEAGVVIAGATRLDATGDWFVGSARRRAVSTPAPPPAQILTGTTQTVRSSRQPCAEAAAPATCPRATVQTSRIAREPQPSVWRGPGPERARRIVPTAGRGLAGRSVERDLADDRRARIVGQIC